MKLAPEETLLGESARTFVDELLRSDKRSSSTQVVYFKNHLYQPGFQQPQRVTATVRQR